MQDVNYINHLNAILEQFSKDDRLNSTHISMYMALFKFWNYLHFTETFHVNREEIMKLSKIGSKSTYHRVVKELSHWNYIVYMPSKNPFKGSKIKMLIFRTTSGISNKQPVAPLHPKNDTSSGQALVSKNKHNKTIINNLNYGGKKPPPNSEQVISFFKNQNNTQNNALKFFNHYQATNWKIGATKIEDWQAMASKWILKSKEFTGEKVNPENKKQLHQNQDNSKQTDYLHTNRNKDYNQPL